MIGLVACGSQKQPGPCLARDLYQGALFKHARTYVERRCGAWGILSAYYGLLTPMQVVRTYDVTLNNMPRNERQRWAREMRQAIVAKWGDQEMFLVVAGAHYMAALDGLRVHAPFKGLRIGEQLQALKRANEKDQ